MSVLAHLRHVGPARDIITTAEAAPRSSLYVGAALTGASLGALSRGRDGAALGLVGGLVTAALLDFAIR